MTAKEPTMRCILVAAFLCLLTASTAVARDLGTFGAVYDIVEKDALKELEEKAKSVDFSKAVDRNALVKKARNFTPEDVKEMKADRSRPEGPHVPCGHDLHPREGHQRRQGEHRVSRGI